MINVFYRGMAVDDPTTYYRAAGVLPYIDNPDLRFKNITDVTEFGWETLAGCDILFLQRPFADIHIYMIKLAKEMGIRVISDYDDDLLNVPVHNNTSITYEEQKRNTKTCINLSDEVWVTTPALRDSYKPFNRNIHIIPNALNDHMFKVEDKKPFSHENKHVIYRGGPSHAPDVLQDVNDIVNTMNGNPDWRFMFMGNKFDLIEQRTDKGNHYWAQPMTLIQFYNYLIEENPQIVFFPLLNNKFNQAKSNICFLEATYAGAAFFGNKLLPEFDMPFIADISGGLYNTFEALRDDFDSLQTMNAWAWEWILKNRLLSNINKLRQDRLLCHTVNQQYQ